MPPASSCMTTAQPGRTSSPPLPARLLPAWQADHLLSRSRRLKSDRAGATAGRRLSRLLPARSSGPMPYRSNSAPGEAGSNRGIVAEPGRCSSPRSAERRLSTWQRHSEAGASGRAEAVVPRPGRATPACGRKREGRELAGPRRLSKQPYWPYVQYRHYQSRGLPRPRLSLPVAKRSPQAA